MYCILDLVNNQVLADQVLAVGANVCPFRDTHTYRSDVLDLNSDYDTNNNFVLVYDSMTSYNWWDAKDYCMIHYGSSLGSIHSKQDDKLIQSLRDYASDDLLSDPDINSFEYEWFYESWGTIGYVEDYI